MKATTDKRLLALEQKRFGDISQNIIRVPQIVLYDVSTGSPLVPPDPRRKQIWIPDNGQGLHTSR